MRNIWNFNTERQQNNSPIDLAELVALQMSKLIWGRGYYLSTENKEIKDKWEKINDINFLDNFFFEAEKMLSAFGYVIICIDIDDKKIPYLNIAQPYGNYQLEEINGEIVKAIVWIRYGSSTSQNYLMRVEYDKKKITRGFYNYTGEENWIDTAKTKKVSEAENKKLLEKSNVPRETIHNLGIVPVCFFRNIPKKNFIGGSQGSDWYPDGVSVSGIQQLLNGIFQILEKEASYNRTRVFADLNPQQIQELLTSQAGIINPDLNLDIRKLIGDFIIPANMTPIEGASSSPVAIIQGDPKFSQYGDLIDYLIDLYFLGCGLSAHKKGEGAESIIETQYINSTEASTIIFKRKYRQQQVKKLLDKVFLVMGINKEKLKDYSFEIKDNTSLNTFEDAEREIQLINMGLSSRIRAYQKLNQVSKEEAIEAIKEIDSENEKFGNPLNVDENLNEEQEKINEDEEIKDDN